MSWATYNETIAEIKEAFDADHATAQEIYRDLRDEYARPVYADDIREEIQEAERFEEIAPEESVTLEEYFESEDETDWKFWETTDYLDTKYFDDDEWLDGGEEVEFTIKYEEIR